MPIDVLLDGPRPGPADPVADAVWRSERSRVFAALVGGPFDPRRGLLLDGAALAEWQAGRRAWLVAADL